MARRLLESAGIMRPARVHSRGFTLAELMAVVVIVAILSTLAIVGYRALLRSTRATEAIQVVGSIRERQAKFNEEFKSIVSTGYATTGVVNTCKSLASTTTCCPSTATPGNKKVGWDPNCGTPHKFSSLNVESDGPVYFGYATQGFLAATAPPSLTIDGNAVGWPGTISQDYYVITAIGDPDGQSVGCLVVSHSFSNQIFTDGNCK